MMNLLSIDVEEWFQVDNLSGVIARKDWDSCESRVERNINEILEILAERNIKATFFVLGWVAERHPSLIKKISDDFHELACHGYGHELVYNMTVKSFKENVKRTKSLIEDATGTNVIGYRAPSFSICDWAVDVLIDLGFKYDSSLVPFKAHDRYGKLENYNTENKLFFKLKEDFYEVPLPCFKSSFVNIPIGGGAYFRLIPYPLFKYLIKKSSKTRGGYLFYIHPWEFDFEQPRIKDIKWQYKVRHYTNLKNTKNKFINLLSDFNFNPICSIFNENYLLQE